MTNKKINLGMAALVASMIMVGCGTNDTEAPNTPSTEQNATTGEVAASGQLSAVVEAVKTAMGEDYLPNTLMEDAEMVSEMYGLDLSLCKEFIVETPMIGMHPDLFIGVEAKDGQVEAVEAALLAYKEQLINDTMQYPMNLPKIAATDVLRVDNYVFLALMGYVDEDFSLSDEEVTTLSKELTQKALTAAKDALSK